MTKKRNIRFVISLIGYGFIFFLVVFMLFVVISNLSGKTVFLGNRTLLWVKTGSMEPEIETGTYIIVEKVDPKDLKVGDIITFVSPDPDLQGAYNTHRIKEIKGDNESFVMRGDNNLADDKYEVPAENVVARYVKKLPTLSKFGRFLAKPVGILTILALIVVATIIIYIPDFKKHFLKQEKNKDEEKQKLIDQRIEEEIKRLKEQNEKENSSNV